MKHYDLTISSDDLNILLFALNEELIIDKRFHESFPKEEGSKNRIDSLERLIHIFEDSGEWVR